MGNYDVLLFGGYFFDLIVTGLPEVPRLGTDLFGSDMGIFAGGTFNTVRALHRLGLRVGWVCDFGNDLFSQFVLNEARQEGVDTRLFRMHDHPVRAFSLAFSFQMDRGFISYIDPEPTWDRVPYVIEHQPRSVLLGHLQYGSEFTPLVAAARQVGALVLMDCQAASATLETPGVTEALRSVDIFLPNISEALQLTGAPTVQSAAEILSEYTPLVVLKMGPEGALAQTRECCIQSPGLEVDAVDTTGAGDCFNAGFLYSRLRGEPLERNLEAGNICGGLSTTRHGSIATPTEAELLRYISG